LLTQDVEGELLVLDADNNIGCRLNGAAALVWTHCDGRRTPADLVDVLREEYGQLADEDMVMMALDTLVEHGLLASGYEPRAPKVARLSRRRFIRRAGVVGASALAVPIAFSMAVPTPAAAGSPQYEPYYINVKRDLLFR
jgi:hypothetical protein